MSPCPYERPLTHVLIVHSQRYLISSVNKQDALLLDLGLLLVAKGIRQEAFADHSDLRSLLSGRESLLRWKPEFMKRPVFCAASERGLHLRLDSPMRYHAARVFFKRTATQANLPGKDHI